MKREEAINTLRKFPIGLMDLGSKEKQDITEAIDMALAALRGPTRERVERIRSHWITVVEINGRDCSKCAACQNGLDELEDAYSFCPRCGAPMTDEAVEITLQRLEVLYENHK